MSLLLDALKRAEQEKLARGDRPDLQIVGPGEGQHSPRHDRAEASAAELELHPLTPPPAAAATAAREKTAAQAAQAVFQAKAEPARDKPRRTLIVAALAVIILAILGAGGYVWYAMKSLTPPPLAPRPAPVPIAPAAPAVAPATSVVATPAPDPIPVAPARVAPVAPPDREQIAAEVLREAQAVRQAPPLRMDRTQETPSVPADIGAGYDALRRGDYAAARRSYQAALAADSANLDANLGLATAEARAGNISAASLFYRKALELDPRNATARAGLAALADASRPGAVEARLREDVLRNPQSAPLRLALGNVYAAQKRWSEAQGEYFEAHRLEPAHPDIAFNLAVSLDNLGQSALAAQFYRRALDAARAQPAQFDPAAVNRRLAEMGS